MSRRPWLAPAIVAALSLVASIPVGRALRSQVPPPPPHDRIGLGRLVGGVLSGPFRPMLQSYLFLRADRLAREGRNDELHRHYRTLVLLYPDNEAAREFLGWHLAFNLKQEARDEELAWRWAREGLDLLMESRRGRRSVAHWALAQCGQNAVHPTAPLRYAGPEWDSERRWRKRLATWAHQRFGRKLSRFETGLAAIGDHEGLLGASTRATLRELLAYERLTREGRDAEFKKATNALATLAREVSDNPALLQSVSENARLLRAVQAGDLEKLATVRSVEPYPRAYRAAVALAGVGIQRGDKDLVEAATNALLGLDRILDPERRLFEPEVELLRAWVRHLADSGSEVPPRFRFD